MPFIEDKPIIFFATVKSTKDPKKIGRVQVELKDLAKAVEMPWLRMVNSYASKEFGMTIYPEVGDIVAVIRGAGDRVGSMLILGSVYDKINAQAVPDKDGKNNIKQILTRAKHQFEISDEDGKEKVSLITSKKAEMVFDDKDSKVHFKVKGLLVEMDGKGKCITIKSDDKIVLDAKNVHIKGSFLVDVKGKDIKIKADMNTKIDGGIKVAIKGGAQVDIQGGAKVAVKGAITSIG